MKIFMPHFANRGEVASLVNDYNGRHNTSGTHPK